MLKVERISEIYQVIRYLVLWRTSEHGNYDFKKNWPALGLVWEIEAGVSLSLRPVWPLCVHTSLILSLRGGRVQGQLGIHRKFRNSQSYIVRVCLKKVFQACRIFSMSLSPSTSSTDCGKPLSRKTASGQVTQLSNLEIAKHKLPILTQDGIVFLGFSFTSFRIVAVGSVVSWAKSFPVVDHYSR